MLRRLIVLLILFIAVVAALGAWKSYSIRQQIAFFTAPKPPIQVSATEAQSIDWQSRLPAIGTLTARQGVELAAVVAGTVERGLAESGPLVDAGQGVGLPAGIAGTVERALADSGRLGEAGQPLLVMDNQVGQASLGTAEAQVELARRDFDRQQNLLRRQSIPQAQFDQASSTLRQARAKAAELRAILQKKTITAPFPGRLGIVQVDPGDYLSPGTLIATLQDLSSLNVDFSLAEQYFPLLSVGQHVELSVAAFPDQRFSGEITAINPRVDASSSALLVRAR